MILRTSMTSPFGRKVRLAAAHLGLIGKMDVQHADATDPKDVLRRDNPLGKMPVLILDDGRCIFDSRVILECLDQMAGGNVLLPKDANARLDCLTQQALADGIMDAAVLIIYEGRYRPQEMHHAPWVEYQRGKVERGLAALARALPDPNQFNVATIATACALGYIDWRKQVDWRKAHPSLIGWYDAFRAAVPVFDSSAPPA